MADNNFNSTVESLFKGMDSFITSKTVVGEAIKMDDGTTVLPLLDVSFGVGAGAFLNDGDKKNNAGGGMGGKIQPSAVIVVKDGNARLVNVKNQDSITKIFDLVPGILERFTKGKDKEEEVKKEEE